MSRAPGPVDDPPGAADVVNPADLAVPAGPVEPATLIGLLDRLGRLLGDSEAPRVAELRRRLGEDRLRVLVAGEAKRGKSTLLNALLGRAVLPAGALPLTAISTVLTHGDRDEVEVTFTDGRHERHPDLSVLAGLVTEDGNPHNVRGVRQVVVRLPDPLLGMGVELVDTPGVGSVYEHNTAEARRAVAGADAAVVVLSADPPVTAAERAFLADVHAGAVRTFVVLNKADNVEPAELPGVVEFTARVAAEALGAAEPVYPVSARDALRSGQPGGDGQPGRDGRDGFGLAEFRAAFTGYLATRREGDLRASIAGHARRLALAAADEAGLLLRATRMNLAELDRRQAAFEAALRSVHALAGESAAVLDAEVRRMVADTGAAAAERGRATATAALAAVAGWAAEHPGAAGRALEAGGWQAGQAVAERDVLRWRERWRGHLDGALVTVVGQFEDRLAGHVEAVRAAAAQAYDIALTAPPPAGGLDPASRFRPASADTAGVTDLLAASVRARLPGRLGRRRVLAHLRAELAEQVDRQFGRARADFQARLGETHRQLTAATDRRLADAADRIRDTVRRATDLARADADQQAAAVTGITQRLAALRDLAGRLDP